MKKLATALAFFAVLSGLYYALYRFFVVSSDDPPQFAQINSTLEPLPCDLNAGECNAEFKGVSVAFELTPRPVRAMQPVNLKISSMQGLNFKNPSVEAHGLNMDMGTIKVALEKTQDGYEGKMVLSSCVIDVMRYRFEVLDEGRKTGLYVDFDLKI